MAGTYMGQCVRLALGLQSVTNATQAFFTTDGLQYNSSILAASSRGKNSKGSKITGMKSSRWLALSCVVAHVVDSTNFIGRPRPTFGVHERLAKPTVQLMG
jgi:hypothetical protein